eukprot:13002.XXX_453654_453842_1 [CDS] Oithona nana genome sequencing.
MHTLPDPISRPETIVVAQVMSWIQFGKEFRLVLMEHIMESNAMDLPLDWNVGDVHGLLQLFD